MNHKNDIKTLSDEIEKLRREQRAAHKFMVWAMATFAATTYLHVNLIVVAVMTGLSLVFGYFEGRR